MVEDNSPCCGSQIGRRRGTIAHAPAKKTARGPARLIAEAGRSPQGRRHVRNGSSGPEGQSQPPQAPPNRAHPRDQSVASDRLPDQRVGGCSVRHALRRCGSSSCDGQRRRARNPACRAARQQKEVRIASIIAPQRLIGESLSDITSPRRMCGALVLSQRGSRGSKLITPNARR